jgi:hypothetical protein
MSAEPLPMDGEARAWLNPTTGTGHTRAMCQGAGEKYRPVAVGRVLFHPDREMCSFCGGGR